MSDENCYKQSNSYLIYLGRGIPGTEYELSESSFFSFLDNQNYIDSFTIWRCEGYWRGRKEKTFVLEVFDTTAEQVDNFCILYKRTYEQQGVYAKQINANTKLI